MTQVSVCQSQSKLHSVHPLSAGGGGMSLQPNFKKVGLAGPQLLEEIAGKEGVIFSGEGGWGGGWGRAIVT